VCIVDDATPTNANTAPRSDPSLAAPVDGKLRLLFITEDDPLYVIEFFDAFFDAYPRDEFDIVGVTIQEAFNEPIWKTARRMLSFYGPVDFTKLCTRYARVKASRRSIGSLAERHELRLEPAASVNDPAYIERARALEPDVIASVAAPEIFKPGILSVPKLGCVNIHSGRLPRYRGMMPNFWQLLEGEAHATLTVHEMVEKLDAGRIVRTLEFPLRDTDSLDRVIRETKRAGAELMIAALRDLAAGAASPTELDWSDKGYYSFPKPADVKRFRQRGHRML
jgi:methionyl-tRNA formyltransferase